MRHYRNKPGLHITITRESIDTKDGILSWDPRQRGAGDQTWMGKLDDQPLTDAELVVRGLFADCA